MTRAALSFFGRYVLASTVLFSAWTTFGPDYEQTIIPAVNELTRVADIPITMERHGPHLLYRYQTAASSFRVETQDSGALHLNLVPFLALLVATVGRRGSWYLSHAACGLVVMWLFHVVLFTLSGIVAAAPFTDSQPAAISLFNQLPAGAADWAHAMMEQWGMWGQYSLCVCLWVWATSRPPVAAVTSAAWWRLPWRMNPASR